MTQLEQQMQAELIVTQTLCNYLADYLTLKGVPSTSDEGLDTLVPKVLLISGGDSENYMTYSGFENRTDSTISIDETTGVFTLAPTTTLFNVWTNGTGKHVITTTQTKTIVADQTISYLYIDENGVLQLSTSPWNLTDGSNAPCAIVFKDGNNYTLTDERHGFARNRAWHEWAHNNIGTMYRSGLVGTFTNTTLSVTQGVIADEDIVFDTLSTKTTTSLWYRNGASGMRMVRNSTTPYSLNGATIQYDNGSGALQPVDNNKYACSWVYGSNDATEPIYTVIGQGQFNTSALALSSASPIINLSTAEWKLLYKVIYQNKNGVTTRIQTVDYRTVQTGVATTQVTPTSHANLTERDAANSHPATAISVTTPSGFTSVEADGLFTEIATRVTTNYTYKIEDTSVPTWAASTKYVNFAFQAQINIADLSESDFVNVVFGVNEAVSGNYAAAIEQYAGYILVFAKVNTAITIPTISVTKIDL